MFMKHYSPNRCEPSIEALNLGGGGGDQGRCEQRSDFCIFVKFQKNNYYFFIFYFFFFWGGGSGSGGGQGRCERRSEVFVKIQKIKIGGGGQVGGGQVGGGGGVRVDVNEKLKFL